MAIEIVHIPERRRFEARVQGLLGEIDYVLDANVMTILHTGVPAALGGRGIAGELTKFALDRARRNGWKVVPACSYAQAYIQRHPDYADLLA